MVFGHTDDRSNYERLIQEFEAHPEPLFLFNITMQNHGGYALSAFEKEGKEIVSIDEKYREYTDAVAFESLMKASDDALAFLMEYFRKTDRPVVLCFFGDHQPAMPGAFEKALEESGREAGESEISVGEKYFRVPYFIWTNDPEILAEREKLRAEARVLAAELQGSAMDMTSPNFLGVAAQVYAGTELSEYSALVRQLRASVPVINETGWLGDNGAWNGWDETEDTDILREETMAKHGLLMRMLKPDLMLEILQRGDRRDSRAALLRNYQRAQYYCLFDPKRKLR